VEHKLGFKTSLLKQKRALERKHETDCKRAICKHDHKQHRVVSGSGTEGNRPPITSYPAQRRTSHLEVDAHDEHCDK
jgi:hypothetical protein